MKLKKLLASILAVCMVLSTMGFNVFAESTSVARVGDAACSNVTEMLNALNNASGEVTVEIYGKLETDGISLNNSKITKLSFIGMSDTAEICVNGVSYIDVRYTNYPIEYIGLILSHTNGSYGNDGRLQEYFSTYNGGNVTYTDCTFPNGVTALGSTTGTTVTFNQCEFNNLTAGKYSLWIDGNGTKVVVNGGNFCGVRGAKLFAENGAVFSTLEVNNATFSNTITEKAAVVLTRGERVVLKDNTFNNNTDKVQVDDDYCSEINGKTVVIDGTEYTVDSESLSLKETSPAEAIVATVNGEGFTDLQSAINAAQAGNTIIITKDFGLDTIITVANGKKITLDLNGKTITGTDNTEKNFSLIDNRGDLTITGNGIMTLTASVNSGWNRYSAVLANNPGGKLTIENGIFEHLGGTDMSYGIDNLTNGKGTYAETVINGGTIKSTYRGIRQFLNGIEAQNILTVNGGTVEGANKSIWMQDPNKNANTGTLTVTEGATLNGDVYLFVAEGSTEWPVEVSIAASAVNGKVLSANVPAGYELVETDGAYTLEEYINLPTATVTSVENDDLTFALNFKADEASAEQLEYYGDWYADFVLTINKDVTFNANGGADGYLSGQYDEWSENWVNVPFEDVTLKAGEPLKIMEYAAKLMNQSGLKLTYNDVYNFVKDFDCGVFFEEDFLAENPDLKVTLELRMYNNEDESENYAIGETYTFEIDEPEDLRMFSLASAYVDYLPISLYPDNIKLYRLGLYSAAESMDYDEYGFEVTVDGQEPVMIKAEKYDGEIMLRVGTDRIDNLKPGDFDYNGSNNVCIFGQTIAFDESAVGEGKVKYRPYVVIDGKIYWGYTFTAPNIYTK